MKYDSIIIGGGPAGLTAGIYLSRAKMNTLIIDTAMPGGQMILTHEIANYPGFESINGYMLSSKMKQQAEKFGCDILSNTKVKNFQLDSGIKRITLESGEVYEAKSVILTTGGRSRRLGVAGENKFSGRGVSYCATCDGDFFRDKEIIVVGGGNTALEEAVSLTTYASTVTIVHQFDYFQAFDTAVQEAKTNDKIDFILNSKITGFIGDKQLESVNIEDLKTGKTYNKNIDGVFIFIGYVPNSESLPPEIKRNNWQEITVDKNFMTNIDGVFAAGDLIEKKYRQITTAVSDGTIAALSALEYNHSH